METLPNWFWIMFYLFLLLTLASAIYSNFKNRRIYLSYISIILSLLVPVMGFLFSLGRAEGQTELGYLLAQLGAGDIWAVLITLFLVYFVVWWFLLIKEKIDIYAIMEKIPHTRYWNNSK